MFVITLGSHLKISCFIISAPKHFRVQAQTTCSTNLLVQNVNNQSGLIQSSFTTTYSSNMDCEWTLSADTKLELVFVGPFTMEGNADFVYVYDGNSSSARLIGRFSGSSRPGPSVSSSNHLHVRFTSDGSSQHYGFKATYRGMFSFFWVAVMFSNERFFCSMVCPKGFFFT